MSALREALERVYGPRPGFHQRDQHAHSALRPTSSPKPVDRYGRQPPALDLELGDLKALDDGTLVARVLDHRTAIAQITDDLALNLRNNNERGGRWQSSAGRARASYRERLKLLRNLRGRCNGAACRRLTASNPRQAQIETTPADQALSRTLNLARPDKCRSVA
jgi:hypothetical protein